MMGVNTTINDKELILISMYLDGKLNAKETDWVQARRNSDPVFNQVVREIANTRDLLHSLPIKRAPRNFTLSSELFKKPVRPGWLQPAMSFVSVAAAALLVVVFAGNFLINRAPDSPQIAFAPGAAMLESAPDQATDANPPQIINWNPVLGMGGGGGDGVTKEGYAGGVGGAGGPGFTEWEPEAAPQPEILEQPPTTLAVPEATDDPSPERVTNASDDLSGMILGLPAEESQGKMFDPNAGERPLSQPLTPRMLVMIISGSVAILAGVITLFLRRQ